MRRRLLQSNLLLREAQASADGPRGPVRARVAPRGDHWQVTRRGFLGGLGAAALLGCGRTPPRQAGSSVALAIVGAGLAGMNCCHHLAKAGIRAEVYEASSRVGGRTYSVDLYGTGQVVELGGEWVNSSDEALMALIDELGLDLLDVCADSGQLWPTYWFDGEARKGPELWKAMKPVYKQASEMARDLPYWSDVTWRTPGAQNDDLQSIAEWMEATEMDPLGSAALRVLCRTDFGKEPEELSLLNLLPFADESGVIDACYKIEGGAQQMVAGLVERYEDRVHTEHPLEALIQRPDGRYVLSFGDKEVIADSVILAIPFAVLRTIDIRVELPPEKLAAINDLAYGSNTKLLVPFSEPFWRADFRDGYLLTDLDCQSCWDATQLVPGRLGVLSNYVGGDKGMHNTSGGIEQRLSALLDDLERVYPGCSQWLDDAEPLLYPWPSIPTSRGSYSAYGVGQWSRFGGAEAEPVGNLYFAGEHTSRLHRGYMNGAAQSGLDAAAALIARL